jgi:hypothetical protein
MQRSLASRSRRAVSTAALVVAALLGLAAMAEACSIPVFRYALERWKPDPYRATLFHRGPLSEAQQAILKPWSQATESLDGVAAPASNIELRLVDIDAIEDEADRALFAEQKSPEAPWLAVQYPRGLRIAKTVWAGPLSEESAARLAASPLRTELINRLCQGQTAVWLMLESGNAEKDQAVAAKLDVELKQLAAKLKLPELSPDDQLHSAAPLQISFSVLRVPRNVPAEQPLVDLLLHVESDLKDYAEPIVFPVFGRGRALLPLIGAGITPDNLHESAAFLVGACSCEIKELNPGFDLLLTAGWDQLLFKDAPPPKDAAVAAPTGPPELVAIPPGAAPVPVAWTSGPDVEVVSEEHATGVPMYVFVLLGGALVVAVLMFGLRR